MKKNMKKTIILSGILCLLLLCGCGGDDNPKETPANTPAPSTELTAETLKDYPESPVSDFEFEEDYETGDISVAAYTGSDDIVVVPGSYEGKPVKYIGALSFANDCPVKAVKLPDSVEVIRDAFTNNDDLELVVFGTGTKKIEECAFLNCAKLREVDINEGVETIEDAFGFCPVLKELYIPSTVTDINTFLLSMGQDVTRTIYGKKGSFIEKEIQENGEEYNLKFVER